MARQRVHTILVKVRFDKPVAKSEARRAFADTVHGTFYPYGHGDAEEMTIVAPKIRSAF